MRQIVLDTETTGLEVSQGHRIIEIGCIEMLDRRPTERQFHVYLNPERDIEEGAIDVHGITNEDLADKPRFADIAADFLAFVAGAELVIHNAPFDVGFLNRELELCGLEPADIAGHCRVLDTLAMARQMHPGQKNSLDALCKRYEIDNSQRTLHGALLDAEILAEVYLAMTGGQATLALGGDGAAGAVAEQRRAVERTGLTLAIVEPTAAEVAAHDALVAAIGEHALWRR